MAPDIGELFRHADEVFGLEIHVGPVEDLAENRLGLAHQVFIGNGERRAAGAFQVLHAGGVGVDPALAGIADIAHVGLHLRGHDIEAIALQVQIVRIRIGLHDFLQIDRVPRGLVAPARFGEAVLAGHEGIKLIVEMMHRAGLLRRAFQRFGEGGQAFDLEILAVGMTVDEGAGEPDPLAPCEAMPFRPARQDLAEHIGFRRDIDLAGRHQHAAGQRVARARGADDEQGLGRACHGSGGLLLVAAAPVIAGPFARRSEGGGGDGTAP